MVGGFHLSGPLFEPLLEPTVSSLLSFRPEFVVPMHCTGRKASIRLEEAFGPGFGLNSVGTVIRL